MYRTKDGVSDGRTAKFLPKYVVASKQQYAQQQAEKHKQANASNSEDGARVNPLSPKSRKFLKEENIGGGKTGGDISTIEIDHKKGSLASGNVHATLSSTVDLVKTGL